RHRQPLLVNLARLLRINKNITRLVVSFSRAHTHSLMPAVHSRDRIRMHRKSHVLMHARILPPDAHRVSILRLVRLDTLLTLQAPLCSVVVQPHGRHQLPFPFISQLPTAQVMTTRNDPGPNAFRHPRSHDVVTNFSLNTHEIAGANTELRRMTGMNPERVRVCDLVEPLRVRAARVNLHGKTK